MKEQIKWYEESAYVFTNKIVDSMRKDKWYENNDIAIALVSHIEVYKSIIENLLEKK